MNHIAEEIMSYLENDVDILQHYGTPQPYDKSPKGSGRYRKGTGEEPNQHVNDFYERIDKLRQKGLKETEIAEALGMTTTELRAERALARAERRTSDVTRAKSLKEHKGIGATEIARIMSEEQGRHITESTVRSWLNHESEQRMNKAKDTAEFLKSQVKSKGMIDVGAGTEFDLNVSREKLTQALKILKEEGYPVYKGGIPQVTNKGKQINQMVLCPPGTEHKEIYDFDKVHSIKDYMTRDGGVTFEKKFSYPSSMDSKRLMIRYAEDGGVEKDGVMELRRGVHDLSLGNSKYSQVRILVDGTHYLKGMAIYGDDKDFPPGVDVIFNTNKKKDKTKMEVLKEIKKDPDNPFGSAIKDADQGGQYWYDPKTGERVNSSTKGAKLGLINKRADEGDWSEWKDKLPAQFLSKQSLSLAKKQLGLAVVDKEAEFDELKSLTNPTVKKNRLQSFAEDCDSAAVHLQAAALPGQKYHVILPNNTLKASKDGYSEIYAPGYEPGTILALVRYPHGGTFEIPLCKVVKSNKLGEQILGKTSGDAVMVNSKVAERLSGADFDGDTVMCIPTHDKAGKVHITSTKTLPGLEGFDSKSYQYDSIPIVDKDGNKHYYRNGKEFKIMKNTGKQMGEISNLITDMTLKGAKTHELAAAVRHSMVVIDAEKHKLDYKQSEIDNNIKALKKRYQTTTNEEGEEHVGGASTLLSRSKGQQSVLKRQGTPKVNLKGKEWYDPNRPEGALIYKTADDVSYQKAHVNKKTGEVRYTTEYRMEKSTKMAETDDARSLISDDYTAMERTYADYANKMKSLANQARVEAANTGKIAYSPSAKATYKGEVDSLNSKLAESLKNAPKERQAQLLANSEINAKKKANPDMTNEEIKKASQQALTKYRNVVGAKRKNIEITDKEWEAIQSGAISENKLIQILNHSDKDRLRELATPRSNGTLSQAKINKIKTMSNSNYSLSEIAKSIGVSTATVSKYLKGEN